MVAHGEGDPYTCSKVQDSEQANGPYQGQRRSSQQNGREETVKTHGNLPRGLLLRVRDLSVVDDQSVPRCPLTLSPAKRLGELDSWIGEKEL